MLAPAPAPEPNQVRFDRDWFNYRGRDWRIFKRGDGPKAKWYLYFEHAKKRYNHALGEVEKRAAITSAKIKIDAVLDGHKETLRASMQRDRSAMKCCTIDALLNTYETTAQEADADTLHRNANCMRLVLRRALGVEADAVGGRLADVLTEATADGYFKDAIRRSKAAGDQEEAARVKRSANSIFNQARSVLAPPLLKAYRQAELVLPDVEPFLRAYKESRFAGVAAVYDPPAEAVIRRTLHAWLRIKNRNRFIAVGLELACGLRKAEVQQVTWGMWVHHRDGWLLDGRGFVKNQRGRFVVPPIDPYWKLLNRRIDKMGWRRQPQELVLQGTATDLEDIIFRRVGRWLRLLGWETQKTNHALRAYSGSLVAMKWGVDRAHSWLRHASVKTTEQHYLHFLNERVFRPETVRIAWAR